MSKNGYDQVSALLGGTPKAQQTGQKRSAAYEKINAALAAGAASGTGERQSAPAWPVQHAAQTPPLESKAGVDPAQLLADTARPADAGAKREEKAGGWLRELLRLGDSVDANAGFVTDPVTEANFAARRSPDAAKPPAETGQPKEEDRDALWKEFSELNQHFTTNRQGAVIPLDEDYAPKDMERYIELSRALSGDATTGSAAFVPVSERVKDAARGFGEQKLGQLGEAGLSLARSVVEDPMALVNGVNLTRGFLTDEEKEAVGTAGDIMKDILLGDAGKQLDEAYNTTMNAAQSVVDDYFAKSEEHIAQAKEGLGAGGKLLVDLGLGAADLVVDAAANAVAPGAGLYSMGTKVFGSKAKEIRDNGGSLEDQMLGGLTYAGIEVLTEMIAGPFEEIYGRSAVGKAISTALDQIDNPAIRRALKIGSDTFGEGFEEMLSNVLNAYADRLLDFTEGEDWKAIQDVDPGQLLYEGLVGSILGLLGSSVETIGEAELAKIFDEAMGYAPTSQEQETSEAERQAVSAAAQAMEQAAQGAAERQGPEPSQVNIDNAAGSEYTGANETNLSEVTEHEPGRSDEDSAGELAAGGEVLEALHQSGAEADGGTLSAGVVRVSEDLSAAYEESGVVGYGLKDSSSDSAAYSSALEEGRNADPEHGWMVTPQTAGELSGKTLLLSGGGAIGVVITSDGDIEGVFKNKHKHKGGALMTLLPQAIEHGGTKLDCYGEGLVNMYAQYGFIPVARVEFNEKYANPGWDESKGRPFVYVMMHNGDSASDVVRKRRGNSYALYTNAELEALPFYDKNSYDAACQYRNSLLEEQNGNRPETRQEPADEREGIHAPAAVSEKFNPRSDEFNTQQNAEAETEDGEARAVGDAGPYAEEGQQGAQTQGEGETAPQSAEQTAPLAPGSPEGALVPPGGAMTEGGGNEPPAPGGEGQQPDGMKRSQTESNTLSGIAEKLGGKQESLYYVPISERQTLTEAVNRVSADRVGEMQTLMDKEMWNAADIDTGLTLYGLLKAESLRSGDSAAANAWAKIVQERGTRSGQALQAFGKWTRSAAAAAVKAQEQLEGAVQEGKLSREEAERIGNDIYRFAEELDSVEDGDLTSLRELIKRQSDYRGTGTVFEKNYMRMLEEVEDFDWLREYATRQLMNMADDVTVTADLGQRLKTWQVNAQLWRLGTFFRNIGGNLAFGAQDTLTQDGLGVALDWMVSKFTGQRTVGLDKGWFSAEARAGARDAFVRSVLEVAGDVDMTGQGSRYGTTANRSNKMSGGGFERFMSRWEQLLGYSLTTSDRVSRGQIEAAQREAMQGFGLTEEEADELAGALADYRLFQNRDTAYKLSKGLHDILNVLGVGGEMNGNTRSGGFGLGDLINPYPGVPANLAVKALEYSPANIIKGGAELVQLFKLVKQNGVTTADGKTGGDGKLSTAQLQQKAVMDVARGIAGVPMIALLTAMFRSGLAKNADDEEDPDAAAQKRAEGRTGVQINLDAATRAFNGESAEWKDGDDLLSIGWLEPMNAFMAIASMIAEEGGEDATASSFARDFFAGSLQSVLEMPVMQNIANAVDTFKYSTAEDLGGKVGGAAVSLAGDAVTGMIPAPVGQTARTADRYYRDVSADSSLETVWNNMRSVIPGLRETLPVKTDNFGNPKEYSGDAAQRFLNNFVLPGAINELNQTEVSAAVERLYEATGDASVYPDRNAPTSFTAGGERYRMNAEERRTYHNTYGQTVERYTGELLTGGRYSGLSDEQKVELIGKIKQYAGCIAKRECMAGRGETYSNKTWDKTIAAADNGEDLLELLVSKLK